MRLEFCYFVLFRALILTLRSFGGVALVSLSDSASNAGGNAEPGSAFAPAPIIGDFLALLSALFYATYVTLLKVRVREESRMDMQLFFGFVGLFNVLFSWPIGVLLHFAHIERFELPVSSRVIVVILINVRYHFLGPADVRKLTGPQLGSADGIHSLK